MANPCTISYKGTEYTYDGWMAELHDGLLDALIKEGSVAFKGDKGLVLAAPTKATKAILKKTQEETIAEILDEKAIAQDTKLTETQKVATTMTKAEFITQKGNEFTSCCILQYFLYLHGKDSCRRIMENNLITTNCLDI